MKIVAIYRDEACDYIAIRDDKGMFYMYELMNPEVGGIAYNDKDLDISIAILRGPGSERREMERVKIGSEK